MRISLIRVGMKEIQVRHIYSHDVLDVYSIEQCQYVFLDKLEKQFSPCAA